jgi:hypothetical protein
LGLILPALRDSHLTIGETGSDLAYVWSTCAQQEVRPKRARVLGDLERLVACAVDPPDVVSTFIEERTLAASRIDLVGAHLLVSAVGHGTNCGPPSASFVPRRSS